MEQVGLARFSFLTEGGWSLCALWSGWHMSVTGGGNWINHRDSDPNAGQNPSVKTQGFVEGGFCVFGGGPDTFQHLYFPEGLCPGARLSHGS